MAENTAPTQKKRRWYHNLADAYRITARTYPWIGWVLGGIAVVTIALGVLVAALLKGGWVLWILTGIMAGLLIDMTLLSFLVRRAMYSQIDGTVGAVYAVLGQIKRGWIVSEQPVAFTREQDLVWRLVGRPGVVLVSEGPTGRVKQMLQAERRTISRVAQNVPVHTIEVGHGDGQLPLAKLERELRRMKKVLTSTEVPAVAARLNALQSSPMASIPKGVDPTRTKVSRRALRGR